MTDYEYEPYPTPSWEDDPYPTPTGIYDDETVILHKLKKKKDHPDTWVMDRVTKERFESFATALARGEVRQHRYQEAMTRAHEVFANIPDDQARDVLVLIALARIDLHDTVAQSIAHMEAEANEMVEELRLTDINPYSVSAQHIFNEAMAGNLILRKY